MWFCDEIYLFICQHLIIFNNIDCILICDFYFFIKMRMNTKRDTSWTFFKKCGHLVERVR